MLDYEQRLVKEIDRLTYEEQRELLHKLERNNTTLDIDWHSMSSVASTTDSTCKPNYLLTGLIYNVLYISIAAPYSLCKYLYTYLKKVLNEEEVKEENELYIQELTVTSDKYCRTKTKNCRQKGKK